MELGPALRLYGETARSVLGRSYPPPAVFTATADHG
jgi:hypothetical protein